MLSRKLMKHLPFINWITLGRISLNSGPSESLLQDQDNEAFFLSEDWGEDTDKVSVKVPRVIETQVWVSIPLPLNIYVAGLSFINSLPNKYLLHSCYIPSATGIGVNKKEWFLSP